MHLRSILRHPVTDECERSLSEEIHAFNRRVHSSSKCRLVCDGQKIEAPAFGLGVRDKWDLARLTLTHESAVGARTIDSYFSRAFFDTNFWVMWSTMSAFQPWHSLANSDATCAASSICSRASIDSKGSIGRR